MESAAFSVLLGCGLSGCNLVEGVFVADKAEIDKCRCADVVQSLLHYLEK